MKKYTESLYKSPGSAFIRAQKSPADPSAAAQGAHRTFFLSYAPMLWYTQAEKELILLDAIPYPIRIRLGEAVPSCGQFAVMRGIPQFDRPEVSPLPKVRATKKVEVRAAVFNVEHGCRIPEILAFLRECPGIADADILFGNELDDGTERSGNIDASRAIADALGFAYAYALEFIELVNPNDQKGYEGNTLFSRWPIMRAEALYVPEGYNWYYDEQKRIGGRVALFCELDVMGKRLGAVCVHLENRTTPALRAAQTAAILEKANAMFGDLPVLIGGDFNTNAFDYSPAAALRAYERQTRDGTIVDPTASEPLFACAGEHGFDWRSCNGSGVPTRRRPTGSGVLNLHLDWIFSKNITCARHGAISTLLSDCDWAAPASPLRQTPIRELSDHNVVWADFRL